jgi:phosphopantetheine adenylyltransferase
MIQLGASHPVKNKIDSISVKIVRLLMILQNTIRFNQSPSFDRGLRALTSYHGESMLSGVNQRMLNPYQAH